MFQKNTIRSLMLVAVSLVLVVIAWKAGSGAFQQWSDTLTLGQKTETVLQFICCALSAFVLLTVWLKLPLAKYIHYAWGLLLVSMSVFSALVWGPPMLLPAIVFGLISAVVAFGVIYIIRKYGPTSARL